MQVILRAALRDRHQDAYPQHVTSSERLSLHVTSSERLSLHVTSSERSESRGPLKSTRVVCRWAGPWVLWARGRRRERPRSPLKAERRSYNSGDFSMRSLLSLSRNDSL